MATLKICDCCNVSFQNVTDNDTLNFVTCSNHNDAICNARHCYQRNVNHSISRGMADSVISCSNSSDSFHDCSVKCFSSKTKADELNN